MRVKEEKKEFQNKEKKSYTFYTVLATAFKSNSFRYKIYCVFYDIILMLCVSLIITYLLNGDILVNLYIFLLIIFGYIFRFISRGRMGN